ncbi:hypothetical protein E2562_020682 [Oryza meyeriana var. granulata]|uniref:Uncharacterized protein n=1 Tax=Oryza meyeriana var. granulata TaxID=110450 RepID=A0A6G1EBF8_9ORYZ|nr:hypothetical protein E2562_020682 [Oryza meyeriana var. granulata]
MSYTTSAANVHTPVDAAAAASWAGPSRSSRGASSSGTVRTPTWDPLSARATPSRATSSQCQGAGPSNVNEDEESEAGDEGDDNDAGDKDYAPACEEIGPSQLADVPEATQPSQRAPRGARRPRDHTDVHSGNRLPTYFVRPMRLRGKSILPRQEHGVAALPCHTTEAGMAKLDRHAVPL